MGHRALTAERRRRPISRTAPGDRIRRAPGLAAAARTRVVLAALLALSVLVILPGVASAQSITYFYVSRQPTLDVNPANAFGFPLNPAQATLGPPVRHIGFSPTRLSREVSVLL